MNEPTSHVRAIPSVRPDDVPLTPQQASGVMFAGRWAGRLALAKSRLVELGLVEVAELVDPELFASDLYALIVNLLSKPGEEESS